MWLLHVTYHIRIELDVTFICCVSVGMIFDPCFTWHHFYAETDCSPAPDVSVFCQHVKMGDDIKLIYYMKHLL
jgi:hypothetical protein